MDLYLRETGADPWSDTLRFFDYYDARAQRWRVASRYQLPLIENRQERLGPVFGFSTLKPSE